MKDTKEQPAPSVAGMDGWRLVPVEPTEEMWCGLARDLMMWLDFGNPTVEALRKHLSRLGVEWPAWMNGESEMQGSGVPSKGTRATLIYKAMLSAAPVPPVQGELSNVKCQCGREYAHDSYDAGFMAGSGMCQVCDSALPAMEPPAQVDEREAFEAEVKRSYPRNHELFLARACDTYANPHISIRWDGFQAGAAWQRTQSSPAPSADGGKVESDEVLFGFDDRSVRVSQEAYSIFLEREQSLRNKVRRLRGALQALEHGLDDYWITTEEGKSALKLRDSALSAQQGEGERG